MAHWFRLYESVLDDPKVQRLKPELFKAWVNLLAIASRYDGALPSTAECAFALRVSEDKAGAWIWDLNAAGLIDKTETGHAPHNWSSRQYKSDGSAERMRRHRERHKNAASDVTVTPSESEAETETDTDTEAETEITRAFALFNDACKRTNWPSASKLDDRRKRRLRDRLKEVGGIDGFALVVAKAEGSEFLTEKWPNFNLDWMLKPENFTKLREGNYDNKGRSSKPTMHTVADTRPEDWAWRVDWHRTKGMWNPSWGPEPGQPGCFVPKEFLQ